MTCIVGLIDNGVTYLGGDSLGSNGWSKTTRLDKKVFHLKDTPKIIMGYTSSFRMGQLLMYAEGLFDKLAILEDAIDHEYMVTKFIPKIIKLFEEGGYSKINNNQKTGGFFLVGYNNQLYEIESDFQVAIPSDNYYSVGCGEEFAMGSLKTTESMDLDPITRIHLALQSATKFSTGVAPPYYIINTQNKDIIELQ